MWKNTEQEEYEASAPAVKAHFHALRAEEAWKREDYGEVTREARLASEKFIEAANAISDKRTIDALMLLAENYEYRAHAAHAKIPERADEKKEESTLIDDEGVSPATSGKAESDGKKTSITMAVGGREPMKVQGFTPMSSGLEALDPRENAQATDQLNQAAEEIEELWRRLHELGLSGGGNADKNHVLMSSRHLSSSLGDSFCLLPTKARTPIGAQAVAIDGGSTLRAAVASRMRNQRVRLMEKQYGPRAAVDARLQPPRAPHTGGSKEPSPSFKEASRPQSTADHHESDRRSSLSGRGSDIHDPDSLHETVKHQKYEIVRLLNTVKTLSNENTTLLKKCDALSQVQEENRELQDSMDKFKTLYNQKLVRIKRALEEWKRQQAQSQRDGPTAAAPPPARNSDLDGRLQQQQLQIQQLTASLAKRDAQVAKYEQWYQTLKAGARAKRNQNEAGGVDGAGTVPRDSFTNSNSLHELSRGRNGNLVESMNANGGRASSTLPHSSSRPPAHPTRRAL